MERRKAQRYDISAPVHVSVVRMLRGKGQGQVFEARNISSSGAFLHAASPLRAGRRVLVEIVLSYETMQHVFGAERRLVVNLSGRVVREESEGMAIRFGGCCRMGVV